MHGWRVQIQRKNRVELSHFSDLQYGGKRKALQAAIAHRDALFQEMHGADYPQWRRSCKRRNNTSGMVGVGRYIAREMTGGKPVERPFWLGFWIGDDGKRHSRKFRVSKYGERQAKALARAAREQALARWA